MRVNTGVWEQSDKSGIRANNRASLPRAGKTIRSFLFGGSLFLVASVPLFHAATARAEEAAPPSPHMISPPPPPPSPEERAFEAVRKRSLESGKESLLLQYLREHPDTPFAAAAHETIEDIQFAPFREQNSVKGYSAFIAQYPANRHVILARLLADEIVFAPFSRQNSIESYTQFIDSFPGNLLVPVAKAAVEDLIFADVKKANSIIAYAEFLRDHADSERVAEARFLKDQLEYEPYRKKDAEEDYREFLRGFPLNSNRADAHVRMMALRAVRVKEETEKICSEAKMQGTYNCDFVSFNEGTLTVRFIRLSDVQQGQQLLMGGPGYAEEVRRRYSEWKNETIKRLLRILGVISVTVA